MSIISTDVHFYDSQLHGHYTPVKQITISEKRLLFSSLQTRLLQEQFETSQNAVAAINLMMAGTNGNAAPAVSSANYSQDNDMEATDILSDILLLTDLSDRKDLEILSEQLADIMTGQCPAGRCTRMYQTFMSFTGK